MKNKKVKIPKNKNNEILIVKVGTESRPDGLNDIKAIQTLLEQASLDKNSCILTHHALSFITIKKSLLNNGILSY